MHWIWKLLLWWFIFDYLKQTSLKAELKNLKETLSEENKPFDIPSFDTKPSIEVTPQYSEFELHIQLLAKKIETFIKKHQKFIEVSIQNAKGIPYKWAIVEVLHLEPELSQDFSPIMKQANLFAQDLQKYIKIEIFASKTPISETATLNVQVKNISSETESNTNKLDPSQDPNYDPIKQEKKSIWCWRIFLRFILFIFLCGLVNGCVNQQN